MPLVALLVLVAAAVFGSAPILADGAAPLSPPDSRLLCSISQLLLTSLPLPSAEQVSALQRLQRLSTEPGALPGVAASCSESTKEQLTRARDKARSARLVASVHAAPSTDAELLRRQSGIQRVTVSRTLLPTANPHIADVGADEQMGYHRQLRTELRASLSLPGGAGAGSSVDGAPNEPAESLLARLNQCELLLLETVPRTLYFDLYQLEEVAKFRSTQMRAREQSQSQSTSSSPPVPFPEMRALSYGDIDVEAGSESSPEHLLWMIAERPVWTIVQQQSDAHSEDLTAGSHTAQLVLQVPIHARYQAARRDCDASDPSLPRGCVGEAVIEAPRIFISCPAVQQQGESNGSADSADQRQWISVPTRSSGPDARMNVPVASLDNRQPPNPPPLSRLCVCAHVASPTLYHWQQLLISRVVRFLLYSAPLVARLCVQ